MLITERFRLNEIQLKALKKLNLQTVKDLLLYLPARYARAGEYKEIGRLQTGEEVVIYGKVLKTATKKAWKKKIPMAEAVIEGAEGRIKAIWFHQAYLAKKLIVGETAVLRGKVTERNGEQYLANPEIVTELKNFSPTGTIFNPDDPEEGELIPVYPETRGLSSGWFYYHNKTLLEEKVHEQLLDPLPANLLKKYNLPKLSSALVWIHQPENSRDAEAARKRFSFEEIMLIQLARLQDRAAYHAQGAAKIKVSTEEMGQFLNRFPFTPTNAQRRAITQALADMATGEPMTRLLEGDVGSGKTAVAASAAFATVRAGFECAYMAPTEILAKQHFESFIGYFKNLGVNIGLITGTGCYKFPSKVNPGGATNISRPQLLKWVANGEIPILIGTHALIQKNIKWKNLALSIIDEQHRFGIMQRSKLVKKGSTQVPHLLSMTATPIPRTLALTIYGDLDLSLLDELPAGRKSVLTKIVPPSEAERNKVYELIREELKAGRQAYVICPRIDEPDPDKELALQARSAKAEQKRLGEKIFPEYMVGLVHSKMKPSDKEEEMAAFTRGETHILVATSVVEVGVNVPNATSIIIEGAERFGLAQLHQLRGRVFRSSHQAYCYLFTESKSEISQKRLQALATAKNGFELAELDLSLRGAGTLSGDKQWGISDLGMEAIRNLKLVEAARESAKQILTIDPNLHNHPELKVALAQRTRATHLE
ncbi:MAG: ATP-dependent DNA helicase RecG [Candidatus Pacebacteria bacterium]|nr:ATP-dependent DNA helicase RecG [Candidatus Paceibacterota bacterium]